MREENRINPNSQQLLQHLRIVRMNYGCYDVAYHIHLRQSHVHRCCLRYVHHPPSSIDHDEEAVSGGEHVEGEFLLQLSIHNHFNVVY